MTNKQWKTHILNSSQRFKHFDKVAYCQRVAITLYQT